MDLSKGGFVVFVVVLDLCMLAMASGNVVFKVHHKFAGINSSLTDFKAHDYNRHGRILSAVNIPIVGDSSPTSVGLYYSKIRIGTPPKDYHVQVDTGSDLLWVNCVGCQKCPKKSDLGITLAFYNPKASSSAKVITCDQQICKSALSGGTDNCKVGTQCSFSVKYGDGSSAKGYFVRDIIQLDRVSGDLKTTSMNGNVAFGCGSQQSSESGSSERALDGILGFGKANSSMLSQLASSKKVKKIFSHCLDDYKGGGIFAIGEVIQPKVKTTPMIPGDHYHVELKAIEVGGQILQLPKGVFDSARKQGTIIDSGTTLAYLPDPAYKQVIQKINAAQPNIKSHIVDHQFTCYKFFGNLDKAFPVISFHFASSLSLKVYPHQYLFEVEDQEWCVGFQDSNLQTKDGKDITLLGDLVLTNKLVTYDIDKKTIGWIEHSLFGENLAWRENIDVAVVWRGCHRHHSSCPYEVNLEPTYIKIDDPGSSSIKLKDEESGKVHLVSSHNISPLDHINAPTRIVITCFLFLMAATFVNHRIN